MKRRYAWLFALIIVLPLVGSIWHALWKRQLQQQALAASTQRPVPALRLAAQDVILLQQRLWPEVIAITGVVEARHSATIKAYVSGELQGLQLREGDAVRQGQEIARVDASEAQARWRQAQQQADAAQAQWRIAQRQHDNNRALVAQGFISPTALLTSEATMHTAQAHWSAAQAVAQAAHKTVEDTVLRSPINGTVARRFVHNGERVSVQAPVLEVVDGRQLEIHAQVTPAQSLQLRVDQSAQIWLSHDGKQTASEAAQVQRIAPTAQAGTRSVAVYLGVLPQAPTSPGSPGLRPGMFVQGQVLVQQSMQLAAPMSAVRTDQPEPYVQVLQSVEGHASWQVGHRTVRLGPQFVHEAVQWVTLVHGVHAGDKLLASSAGGLRSGSMVEWSAPQAAPGTGVP